ncbi:MAG: PqqD family protein [Candidatus Electrothrix sp. AR3]|nr:PqqD family protein [Candidatus Electrothrix sp. AR3]
MESTQKFTQNADFQAEKFDNEILLYAISSGNGVYLNETAYLVWEMSGKGHSVGEMIALLEEAFPEQKEAIADDVLSAVESMLANKVLLYGIS